jgi:predicted negative regulator of RcsB-dependent stress response
MQTEEAADRIPLLENILNNYSGTDGALWSKLELAHLEFQAGKVEAAIAKYQEILQDISAENSLLPLVRLNLAQGYEEAGQYEKAVTEFQKLKTYNGFMGEAYLGLGRIYTAQGNMAKARQEYEEFLAAMEDGVDPQLRVRVQALLTASGGEISGSATEAGTGKE